MIVEPTPERDPNILHAPFTEEQVENLNLYQISGVFHPFTSWGEVHSGKPGRTMLIATQQQWVCPDKNCDYTQDWVHSSMTNRSLIEHSYRMNNGRELSDDIDRLKEMLQEYINSFK